jgi:hypothetical protein
VQVQTSSLNGLQGLLDETNRDGSPLHRYYRLSLSYAAAISIMHFD